MRRMYAFGGPGKTLSDVFRLRVRGPPATSWYAGNENESKQQANKKGAEHHFARALRPRPVSRRSLAASLTADQTNQEEQPQPREARVSDRSHPSKANPTAELERTTSKNGPRPNAPDVSPVREMSSPMRRARPYVNTAWTTFTIPGS